MRRISLRAAVDRLDTDSKPRRSFHDRQVNDRLISNQPAEGSALRSEETAEAEERAPQSRGLAHLVADASLGDPDRQGLTCLEPPRRAGRAAVAACAAAWACD